LFNETPARIPSLHVEGIFAAILDEAFIGMPALKK